MTQRTIQFFYDFMSPYAYLALHRLVPMAGEHGCVIEYMPVGLGDLKLQVGNTSPPTRDMPVKIRYIRTDLARWAMKYGVQLHKPTGYDSGRLNCATWFAARKGDAHDYVTRAMKYVWNDGISVESPELLKTLATELGWNHPELMDYLASIDVRQTLHQANLAAAAKGVFGSPTMVLDDEIWWGNDRLDFLEQYLQETTS